MASGWRIGVAAVAFVTGCGGPDREVAQHVKMDLVAGSSRSDSVRALTAGALAPGDYAAFAMEPPASFTVGDGWGVGSENPHSLWMYVVGEGEDGPPGGSGVLDDSSILIVNVSDTPDASVMEPPTLGDAEPVESWLSRFAPFPADYEAWLRSVPFLDVGEGRESALGGASGVQFDIVVGETPPGTCHGDGPDICFVPLADPTVAWTHHCATINAHLVRDRRGDLLVVLVCDAFLHADEVGGFLDSLRFGTSS